MNAGKSESKAQRERRRLEGPTAACALLAALASRKGGFVAR